MRHKPCSTAAFQRAWIKPGKSAQTWLAAVRIPQLDPLRVKLEDADGGKQGLRRLAGLHPSALKRGGQTALMPHVGALDA